MNTDKKVIEEIVIEDDNGTKEWFLNGLHHRDNDKPAIEWIDGSKHWYKNGLRHRDNDKPAIEYSVDNYCTKEWWLNGKLHRDNSHAIEYANGTKAWVINGVQLTEKDFISYTRKKKIESILSL